MKTFGFVCSLIFSFLLVIFVVLSLLVFNISAFSSKKEIEKNLLNTDLKLYIGKVRNSGSMDNQTKISLTINEIYSMAEEYVVSEDVIDDILDSKVTKEILSKSLGNLTDYFVNGKDSKVLSSDYVYDLVSSNMDELFRKVNYNISDGQKEKFLNRLKMELPDLVDSFPTVSQFKSSKYSGKIRIIQFIFGKTFKTILVCGIIVLSVLIIFLRKGRCLFNFGFCLLISCLLTIGVSLFIPDLFLKFISIWEISLFISSFSGILCKWLILNSVAGIFVSIIILLIGEIINRHNNLSLM